MTLGEARIEFSDRIRRLLNFLHENGIPYRLDEFHRPPELVKIYAAKGVGSLTSVHPDGLAGDIDLVKDGSVLTKSEDYRVAGEFWESLSTPDLKCVWGGRFIKRPDGRHFSCEWYGRK